ncbi:glycoside hydrolase family 2 [Verrucomicrobia bacterium S94]|nr:glycoside hydrolase family 2 [Verrucomicrobia bacterium S94]
MRGILVALSSWIAFSAAAQHAERVYLSGKGPSDAVEWDFFCSKGRKSGEWTKIPVPSNWEQQGFGAYNYGHEPAAEKADETGRYKTTFFAPKEWKDKHVRLVFEGSMTQTEVTINGKQAGFPNYGGYLPFRYILDKTKLKYGEENVLEVLVKKKPDNDSLDQAERKADFWVFGGIYRPVYLEVLPREFVNRVAIDARMDGSFRMDVFPQVQQPTKFREEFKEYVDELTAQIQTLDGENVGKPMIAPIYGSAGRIRLENHIKKPSLWSPEHPNLYQVKLTMKHKGKVLSTTVERFGFRTFEHRLGDGLYLNGKRILIKGVNRNVFDPQHGRAIDAERVWREACEIKAMNANLVRSHMPPTMEFMRACDELGLMVITELCNWHDPVIDTPIARNLVYELVTTYQNHPSVIIWANGNENGFNLEVDELYHLYDLQNRPIIHPWAYFEGMNTKHYPDWKEFQLRLSHDKVYLPTEFLHGLYDGGHGAGLQDYWDAIKASPIAAGGVLWCWADAAIARTDREGMLDTDGNHSADGIVGPNGEKEASYYSIREIWSPIQIAMKSLPDNFSGKIPLENRFYETRLDACSFEWKLVNHTGPFEETQSSVQAEGRVTGPKIKPGKTGMLKLRLPENWKKATALELRAFSSGGREIMQWAWPIRSPEIKGAEAVVRQADDNPFEITAGTTTWKFSPETGQLLNCSAEGFGRGPVLYAGTLDGALEFSCVWKTSVAKKNNTVVIRSVSEDASFSWTVLPDGSAVLDYDFSAPTNELVYAAIGFDLEEAAVASKRWLGQGPDRIWGNRLRGPQFGLWENEYNDHVVGVNWGETPFKGIFGNVDWMQLNLKSGKTLVADTDYAAVGVLRPANAEGERNKHGPTSPVHAWWHYPESGGLYLFHKLPGTGTKFANAWELGPQGNVTVLKRTIAGRIQLMVK